MRIDCATSVFYDFAIVKRKLVMMIKVLSGNVGSALIFFSLFVSCFFFLSSAAESLDVLQRQIDIDSKVVRKLSWKIVR